MEDLRAEADAGAGPAVLIDAVARRTGYVAELEAQDTLEAAGRLENIAELMGAAVDYDSLDEFLESVALVSDADEIEDDGSRVSLMTLHTAKGLEFPAVFLVGMEDGVFPHLRSLDDPSSWRRNGGWPTWGSPGPAGISTSPTPGAGPCGGRPATPSPAGSCPRSRPSSSATWGLRRLARPDPTRLRAPPGSGADRTGRASASGTEADEDESWSAAADSAHDEDAWHDPDPWDDDGRG
jgi:DNA helicase-2/ATP-dependent DNA helicase PcrA